MPTTITIKEGTRRRLASYKRGGTTFDDLLNRLMDKVDLEDVVAEDVAEHYRILNDPKGVWYDGDDVIAELRGELKGRPRVVRRGPWPGVSSSDRSKSKKGPQTAARGSAAPRQRRIGRTQTRPKDATARA